MKWDPRNLFRGRTAAGAVKVSDEEDVWEDIPTNRAQRRAVLKRQRRELGKYRVRIYEHNARTTRKQEAIMSRVRRLSEERKAELLEREEAKVRQAAEDRARSLKERMDADYSDPQYEYAEDGDSQEEER